MWFNLLGCWEESNMSAVRHFWPSDVIGVSPWNFNRVSNLRFDTPSTKVACPALSWSCKAPRYRLWECYLYIHVSLPLSSPHSLFVNCVNRLWFPRLSLSIAKSYMFFFLKNPTFFEKSIVTMSLPYNH